MEGRGRGEGEEIVELLWRELLGGREGGEQTCSTSNFDDNYNLRTRTYMHVHRFKYVLIQLLAVCIGMKKWDAQLTRSEVRLSLLLFHLSFQPLLFAPLLLSLVTALLELI